jgi:putative transposase
MDEKKNTRRRRALSDREPDFLDEMLHKVYSGQSDGKRVGITDLIQDLVNELMKRDRDNLLGDALNLSANGFYKRDLKLTLGDLNLKIPRIRSGSQFRPAILPPHWKRIDKDYEELLIAMLCNGYSYAQIERSCKKLGLPFSKETLNDSLDFIAEKMDYYKNRPLDKEWIAVFIDACHTQMRDENRKNQKTVIFVACGIKLICCKRTFL